MATILVRTAQFRKSSSSHSRGEIMFTLKLLASGAILAAALTCPAILSAQTDPGPRQPGGQGPGGPGGGPGGANPGPSGQASRGLAAADMQAFLNGKNTFSEVETVAE